MVHAGMTTRALSAITPSVAIAFWGGAKEERPGDRDEDAVGQSTGEGRMGPLVELRPVRSAIRRIEQERRPARSPS